MTSESERNFPRVTISAPLNFAEEKRYVFEYLFTLRLQVPYELQFVDSDCYTLSIGTDKTLVIQDCFFGHFASDEHYAVPSALPKNLSFIEEPFSHNLPLTVLYGDPKIERSEGRTVISADVVSIIFFFLSRWEESLITSLDSHRRVPASETFAVQNSIQLVPTVDLWVSFIAELLTDLHPGFDRLLLNSEVRLQPSHDIDYPFKYLHPNPFQSFVRLGRECASHALGKLDILSAYSMLKSWSLVQSRNYDADPFYRNIEWLMNISEDNNVSSTFFFLVGLQTGGRNGLYSITNPVIRQLLRQIHTRGHRIGFHGSYNSLYENRLLQKEYSIFREVCAEEKIEQNHFPSRQHYLCWRPTEAVSLLEKSGITQDETIGYADTTGFRAGTSHSFFLWDLHSRRQSSVIEQPLLVMDRALFSKRPVTAQEAERAQAETTQLLQSCIVTGGYFSFLWHNSFFLHEDDKDFYRRLFYLEDL
jgi:hypothetical protein